MLKDSPELPGVLEEFKEIGAKVTAIQALLNKIGLQGVKPSDQPSVDRLRIYFAALVGYCTNLNFYLLLKSKAEDSQRHPVLKRILQYKKGLDPVHESYSSLAENLETKLKAPEPKPAPAPAKQLPSTTSHLEPASSGDEGDSGAEPESLAPPSKKRKRNPDSELAEGVDLEALEFYKKFELRAQAKKRAKLANKPEKPKPDPKQVSFLADTKDKDRRKITRQMLKNQGLKRYRKKVNRNSRVKLRLKFQQALKMRRSQHRAYKGKVVHYGGEYAGIRDTVTRSVPLRRKD